MSHIYKFRDCYLDTVERRVVKDDRYLELTPKTFDVLQMLVENVGQVVTKDEILGKVWNGSFVEEGNLAVHISKLRNALKENKTERYIETAPGNGYRFVSPVQPVSNVEWKKIGLADQPHMENSSLAGLDSQSYRLYLKGTYLLNKHTVNDVNKAIECFQAAVSYDPTNVLGYIGTAQGHRFLYVLDQISHQETLGRIRPILKILKGFDQDLDLLQVLYAEVNFVLEWNFLEAEKHLRKALELKPNSLPARHLYTQLLIFSGQYSEALKELHEIILLDSVSILNYKRIARCFWLMERFHSALFYLEDALDLEPNDFEALGLYGVVLAHLGRYDEALSALEKSIANQFNIEFLSFKGYVFGLLGRKDEALGIIREIEKFIKGDNRYDFNLATIYAGLGNAEKAFFYLDQAFDRHEADLIGLTSDIRWKSIRDDSRFRDLVSRVGLPSN